MTTLQATLLLKPPFSIPSLRLLSNFNFPKFISYQSRVRKFSVSCCTLQPQKQQNDEQPSSNSNEQSLKPNSGIESDIDNGNSASKLENPDAHVDSEVSTIVEERESGVIEEEEVEGRLPTVVFFVGLWAMLKRGFERIWLSERMSWWPWHQEKRLDRLIAEADANPTDAARQSALLAELNKHSPESVIERFQRSDITVDSRGVVEYLRALVATNAIADYLPDEQSGKPSGLPTLLQELKQRASGNIEELSLTPGISEKQPLHVVMVDPKVSNKSSRLVQELFSTILFTVAVGLIWIMGASALQKYVNSLGGIGTSGVGSSSSYSTKELSKEVLPEKNVKTFKDVKGCDDAKQELEEVVEYLKNPTKFTRLGGKLPKGILLTGAPGTGKTLLAKAIAGEAGVPFFYRAGSEFEEMFVGVGARRVRSLFQAAKKKGSLHHFY